MSRSQRRGRYRAPNGAPRPYWDGKRWMAPHYVDLPDGTRIRVRGSGATQAAAIQGAKDLAERRVREAAEAYQAARPQGHVGTWVEHWMTGKAPTLRPSTVTSYQHAIKVWILPNMGDLPLGDLTLEHIERVHWKITDSRLSRTNWATVLTVLKQSLSEAVRRGHLTVNPAALAPSPGPRVRRTNPLSAREAQDILNACLDPADQVRWRLAMQFGLRQGEALGLQWRDIDLESNTLRVERTLSRVPGQGLVYAEPKTQKSRRTFRLTDNMTDLLRHHKRQQRADSLRHGRTWSRTTPVVTNRKGAPRDPSNDAQRWKAALAAGHIERHVTLHDARHTAATLMINNEVDIAIVSSVLGHSSIATTADIYGHVTGESALLAMQKVEGALSG